MKKPAKHGRKPGTKILKGDERKAFDAKVWHELKSSSIEDTAKKFNRSVNYVRKVLAEGKKNSEPVEKTELMEPVGAVAAMLLAQEPHPPVEVVVKQPEGTPIKKLGKIFITIDVQYEESAS